MTDKISILRFLVSICVVVFSVASCGVRGKPQPPTTPPEIGRGQPTFRRATEPFAYSNVPPVATPKPDESNKDGSKPK